jgi:hypothetical protein
VLQTCNDTTCFEVLEEHLRSHGVTSVITERWLDPPAQHAFLTGLYSAAASGESPEARPVPAPAATQPSPQDPAARTFDVFLCHNAADKPSVREIGRRLIAAGVRPWLDEWELPPGQPWMPLLEEQIEGIPVAAIFIGASGIGDWQQKEIHQILHRVVKRGATMIPVILSEVPHNWQLPGFLSATTVVDFRPGTANPIERLIWGITGRRPASP